MELLHKEITDALIGAAFEVHDVLGYVFLERVYQRAMKVELELRQRIYLEAVQTAGVLATPDAHSEAEVKEAKKRFRELYVTDLTLVEGGDVENGMMGLASEVDPEITNLTAAQQAAYQLAHALRNSLVKSWGMDPKLVDNPHQ